jgi:hypothetical protein
MLLETGMLILSIAILYITFRFYNQYDDPILLIEECIHKVKNGKKLNKIEVFLLSQLCGSPRKMVIRNELKDHSAVRCPLTVQEIRSIVKALYKKCPLTVIGIKSIRIVERPSDLKESVRGIYATNCQVLNGDIYLYPFLYDDGFYYHKIYIKETGDERSYKADEQLTKYSMINTLLHEIGHHFRFATTGDLHGDEVEEYCDQFSTKWAQQLNLTPGVEQTEKMVMEYELNQLRKQRKAYEERLKELKRLLEEKKKQEMKA